VVRVLKRFKPITADNYNSSYSHTSLHIICVSTAHCKHGDELTQCMSYKENKLKPTVGLPEVYLYLLFAQTLTTRNKDYKEDTSLFIFSLQV